MLIKTDSKNYTDIANAIREFTGGTEKYKPEEMVDAIKGLFMDYGVSYDSFDSKGNVIEATTYGNKIYGLGGHQYLLSFNFSKNAKSVAPFAFKGSALFSSVGVIAEDRELELPDGIEVIEPRGLFGTYFKSIKLPNSITEIGEFGISTNIYLESLNLPENVTKIPQAALSGNTSLTELTIPSKVDTIEELAFVYCSSLITVTFLGTPSTIGRGVFDSCSKLTTINVPWSKGEVANAPWGATNAIINYNYVTE